MADSFRKCPLLMECMILKQMHASMRGLMETIVTGTLTYWDAEKKIGFIDPDRQFKVANSIFIHFTGLKDPRAWEFTRRYAPTFPPRQPQYQAPADGRECGSYWGRAMTAQTFAL